MKRKRFQRRTRGPGRAGAMSLDLVISLSVFFSIAMVLYYLALVSCNNLHHIISNLVGFPYS